VTDQLGPFRLEAVVGEGAMGQVWRALHVPQNVPVAIKVLKSRYGAAAFRDAFRNEARAVARLDHPHIVMVLEHGEVPASHAGPLEVGSPFLVMDYASSGSLDAVDFPLPFSQIKAVLLTLLDALAHAHARGVVHRDLKPGNVLLADAHDARPGLKLTDFGIAHAVHREGRADMYEQTTGTPFYMAPEQFQGRFRDYGPWTDLYALGCLGFELASGRVPFVGESLVEQAYQHMHGAFPEFAGSDDVPVEFEGWLRLLLAKAPRDRYQRAADAAWALLHIGPPPSAVAVASLGEVLASAESRLSYPSGTDPTLVGTTSTLAMPPMTDEFAAAGPVADAFHTGQHCALMPLPTTWRRSEPPLPMRLVGAGLGLYGLRDVPLVGREAARDAIWAELEGVVRERAPRLVVLEGTGGVGKSRLAQWIGRRADEVGAATVLTVYHSAERGPTDGLRGMVARHLGCSGLEPKDARERMKFALTAEGVDEAWEIEGLTTWLLPSLALRGRTAPADAPTLIRRLLRRLTSHRALILRVEDLHFGADTLLFLAQLLEERGSRVPLLIIATVRPEEFAPSSLTTRFYQELRDSKACKVIAVPELSEPETEVLVREVLGLEDALVDDVVRRSNGQPLFVTQLIEDWVHRGVLEAGPSGFVLRSGERATIPDSIHAVMAARIDRLVARGGQGAEASMQLAALLGREVDLAEWRTAAAAAETSIPPGLLDSVLAQRLAVATQSGFAFRSELLRESLLRKAEESGRAPAWHTACVTMLRATRAHRRGVSERIGRHLFLAGRPAEAIEPLRAGARARRADGDFSGAMAALEMRRQALSDAGLSGVCDDTVEQWLLESDVHRRVGQLDAAAEVAHRALAGARTLKSSIHEANALRLVGEVARNRGDFAAAREHLEAAAALRHGTPYDTDYGWTLLSWSDAALRVGDVDEAQAIVATGRALSSVSGDPLDMGRFEMGLGRTARARGRNLDAAEHYDAARELMEQAGSRLGIALCVNSRADIARFQGDLGAAEAGYRRAKELYDSLESVDRFVPPLNLALVLLAREQYIEAHVVLREVVTLLEAMGRRGALGLVWLALVPCAAGVADWAGFDRYFDRATQTLAEGGMTDPDIAWPAELAGTLALTAGKTERARRTLELSRRQWSALGRSDDAQRITDLLASITA
jgi:eukaryotic-like serine/threonine-protein kinase